MKREREAKGQWPQRQGKARVVVQRLVSAKQPRRKMAQGGSYQAGLASPACCSKTLSLQLMMKALIYKCFSMLLSEVVCFLFSKAQPSGESRQIPNKGAGIWSPFRLNTFCSISGKAAAFSFLIYAAGFMSNLCLAQCGMLLSDYHIYQNIPKDPDSTEVIHVTSARTEMLCGTSMPDVRVYAQCVLLCTDFMSCCPPACRRIVALGHKP